MRFGIRLKPFGRLCAMGLFLVILGCSAETKSGPPRIRYGEQVCSRCQMLISEAPYAASLRTADGKVHRFDDAGCLLAFVRELDTKGAQMWVHDHETEASLEVRQAFFVHSPRQITPMGYGLVAFAEEHAAKRHSESVQGRVLRWEDLPEVIQAH